MPRATGFLKLKLCKNMPIKGIIVKGENMKGRKTMNINKRIKKVLEELVELGLQKGFQDPQVIKKSQMLDKLINQYYRTQINVKAVS